MSQLQYHLTSSQSFDITNKILGENFKDLIHDQIIIIIAHQDQY